MAELYFSSNFGFATAAREFFPRVVEPALGAVPAVLHVGITCASFSDIVFAASRWKQAGGGLDKDNEMIVELSTTASHALERLGVPEESVARMLDVAGGIVRDRRLVWVGRHPYFETSAEGTSPFVSLCFRLPVSVRDAAEMNWALAEGLAEFELMPAGVTVSFIGIGEAKPE